jgi:uncharacterized protein (TIGR04255 family)
MMRRLLRSRRGTINGDDVGYKKPLLTEIYAELHLGAGAMPQAQLLKVVNLLQPTVPEVEIGSINTVEVNPALGQVVRKTEPRLRCWSVARDRLVQLSADLIVVNQLGDYLGWKVFDKLFREVHGHLTRTNDKLAITSVSLNTIDQMEIDLAKVKDFRLGKYLACGGRFLPKYYDEVREPCDISLGHGVLATDGFNRQVRVALRVEGNKATVQMNGTFQRTLGKQNELFALLEGLHTESTETFEALITDETRRHMGGKE